MTTPKAIEKVITSDPKIATHPKLQSYCTEYLAALEGGYTPSTKILTKMFDVLIDISTTKPPLASALINLETEIVEQVLVRDTGLASNPELGAMLAFYAGRISGGYDPDDSTAAAIVGALEGVTTSDPALQDLLDTVTDALAPEVLPSTFGVTFTGVDTFDLSGFSVSSAGDVSSDGIDDILIGAFGADNHTGETYVVFGSIDSFGPALDLSTLDGTNGFTLRGIDINDDSGRSVSSAGDVNGDGIDDILIGSHGAKSYAGETYVVFGSTNGFAPVLDLSTLDGTNGFTLRGGVADNSGFAVSSGGDVNGDGIDDILIGAVGADPSGADKGRAYVVFGSAEPFSSTLDLSALDGSNGFALTGTDEGDKIGYSVSSAGDVNGDGIDDILIGGPEAERGQVAAAGETYVVFGTTTGFAPTLELSTLDGTNGFALTGIGLFDRSGFSVSTAGDVNSDGIDDILIGAYGADNHTGETYVVFGGREGFAPTLDVASLNGENGFTLRGMDTNDFSGLSVSSAGDVNGDGVDDILVGAVAADPNDATNAGETYLVFGGAEGFNPTLDLSTLDGTNGFVLAGIGAFDESGVSVSSAGDVNGDGIDDLLIGASRTDSGGQNLAGETYLVYGGGDLLDRLDFVDGVKDGVIHLTNLGLNPADYDPLI